MSRRPRLGVGVGGRNASRLLERSDDSLQVRQLESPGAQSFNLGRFEEPDATPPFARPDHLLPDCVDRSEPPQAPHSGERTRLPG